MKKKLNRRRFAIKNEKGQWIGAINAISLVDKPAIQKSYALFADNELPKINFQVTDEEKMEITGIAMSPDQDIIRFDDIKNEYYYAFFTKSDIVDYRNYFMRYGNTKKANTNHEDNYSKDFFITESWIIQDATNDKMNALGFSDIKEGDWAITYKITNPVMWEEIKNSNLTGFSIEMELNEFTEVKIKAIAFDENLTDVEKEEVIKKLI